ncbi:MAG: DUF2510 domain-containing protein [Galbitalea sp.]
MSADGTPYAEASTAIPAGWYPDPAGGDGTRWWDGGGWTAEVRPAPVVTPPVSTFGSLASAAEFRVPVAIKHGDAGIAYTRTSWWIAFSPLWTVVPEVIAIVVVKSIVTMSLSAMAPELAAANLVLLGILVGLAHADRAALARGGNETTASPWWILLTPLAYLIARAQRVRLYAVGGWASVIWWCVAVVITPGVAALGIFAVYGLVVP